MNRVMLELPDDVTPEDLPTRKDDLVHIRLGGTGKPDVRCGLVPADDWQPKITLAEQVLAENDQWSEMGGALQRYQGRVLKLLTDGGVRSRGVTLEKAKDEIMLAMTVNWLERNIEAGLEQPNPPSEPA